jgi:hypothetical protein
MMKVMYRWISVPTPTNFQSYVPSVPDIWIGLKEMGIVEIDVKLV